MTNPADIARADQHFANVSAHLDTVIAAYSGSRDADPTRRVVELVQLLSCPHKSDGTSITHEQHVGTLANLLGVAVDRLEKRR